MLFGTRKKRLNTPMARPATMLGDHTRALNPIANGPDTPVMDVSAMKRALDHAAWRDPCIDRRRNDEIRAAIRTLERTASCVDLAQERLSEAGETLVLGQATPHQVMRGLLTARFEELLDSLERVITLAQDGPINLLGGTDQWTAAQKGKASAGHHQNGLSLEIGTAGFYYVLSPIHILRGKSGLDIPVLENGFGDNQENYEVETALLKAQQQLARFAARLSHDATMLVNIAQAKEAADASEPDICPDHANDCADLQTESGDIA